jgi:hypothetical protein
MNTIIILAVLLVVSVGAVAFLARRLRKADTRLSYLERRFQGITDLEREKARIITETESERIRIQTEASEASARTLAEANRERARIQAEVSATTTRLVEEAERERTRLQAETTRLTVQRETMERDTRDIQAALQLMRAEHALLDEEANLRSFGYYEPRWDLENSERYAAKLEEIRAAQKSLIQSGDAAVCPTQWEVGGSKVEGRKMTARTLKLLLRAFNGECDAAIAKVKYNNFHVMEQRIIKAFDAINKLGEVQNCSITRRFVELRLDELSLSHEYQEKLQEEKEEQRRVREQMREEEIALRELEKARQDAEKEEKRYETALARARAEVADAQGDKQARLLGQIEELQRRLDEAHANKERAIARAQMTRSGHVYVISNLGSFGEHVYKIGMTRRLDPQDRIRELGDASVPFQFDVHAVIFSEDAPKLENALHKIFRNRRINWVNDRKEFFHVSLDEIEAAVHQHHGTIEFLHFPEAEEYRKTLAMIREEHERQPSRETEFFLQRGIKIVSEPELAAPVLA